MLEKNQFANCKHVATWILNHVDRGSGEAITHLKLQKLVFYVEAWFLANFDRPLFQDAQAWTHGPVFRSIYNKYKGSQWEALPSERVVKFSSELEGFISAVYEEYGQFSAKRLERMTHEEDPWKITRGDLPLEARCDDPIDKLLTRNYYAQRLGKKDIKTLQN